MNSIKDISPISYIDALKILSPREIEILDLLIDGNTNQDVAKVLFISKSTVETHKKNICFKLNINGVASLNKWGIHAKYKNTSFNQLE